MICSKYQKALDNCVITSYILRIDESLEFFDKKKMYLITCYAQNHDVRFVFTLCLSKKRFIKRILKAKRGRRKEGELE